jgi:dolichyl-phosphate beta-glucosyltransferase
MTYFRIARAGPQADRSASTVATRTGRARFHLAVRLATGLPSWDTQCGFKAFRMSVCRPLVEAATVDRFGFDVELLYLGVSCGMRLKEVPVRWDHNEGSKISLASDSISDV